MNFKNYFFIFSLFLLFIDTQECHLSLIKSIFSKAKPFIVPKTKTDFLYQIAFFTVIANQTPYGRGKLQKGLFYLVPSIKKLQPYKSPLQKALNFAIFLSAASTLAIIQNRHDTVSLFEKTCIDFITERKTIFQKIFSRSQPALLRDLLNYLDNLINLESLLGKSIFLEIHRFHNFVLKEKIPKSISLQFLIPEKKLILTREYIKKNNLVVAVKKELEIFDELVKLHKPKFNTIPHYFLTKSIFFDLLFHNSSKNIFPKNSVYPSSTNFYFLYHFINTIPEKSNSIILTYILISEFIKILQYSSQENAAERKQKETILLNSYYLPDELKYLEKYETENTGDNYQNASQFLKYSILQKTKKKLQNSTDKTREITISVNDCRDEFWFYCSLVRNHQLYCIKDICARLTARARDGQQPCGLQENFLFGVDNSLTLCCPYIEELEFCFDITYSNMQHTYPPKIAELSEAAQTQKQAVLSLKKEIIDVFIEIKNDPSNKETILETFFKKNEYKTEQEALLRWSFFNESDLEKYNIKKLIHKTKIIGYRMKSFFNFIV